MTSDEITNTLLEWAPELATRLNSLDYLGSELAVEWFSTSPWPATGLSYLIRRGGHATAAEMWRHVLWKGLSLSPAELLIILEHFRKNPSAAAQTLSAIRFDFCKTLANTAFRAGEALHESAKQSFADDEIDIAIARFRAAISEFRFSIESNQLTPPTTRLATGKYATGVAMIGRWSQVPSEALARALRYSQDSMELGNRQPETFSYRLELLVQQFDRTGNIKILEDVIALLASNEDIAQGTELSEAEAHLRLSMLARNPKDAATHLATASNAIARCLPRRSVEEARRSVLFSLVTEAKTDNLRQPATSISIPRGILSIMATKPSPALWSTVRRILDVLATSPTTRNLVPAGVLSARFLRQIVDGPKELLEPADLDRYVEVTSWLANTSSWNRNVHWEAGAAALSAAKRTGQLELALRAKRIFEDLASRHAKWPLPHIGIARTQDYLDSVQDSAPQNTANRWVEAARSALDSPVYARSNLGGRNEVFAVTDARGFLSETFVFKLTTLQNATHEARMLNALHAEITSRGFENRFEVPRSLAIVEIPGHEDRRWVHVSQRAAGRLVSDLLPDEATSILGPVLELLAVFHGVAGMAPAGKSAWRPLKEYLKMWSKTLFEGDRADRFVTALRDVLPENLPLVRKRDGHASNWLVDPAGRIIAIDFESVEFVPIGFDVAQLLEDNALVPATSRGWEIRIALMTKYLDGLGIVMKSTEIQKTYSWFALTRALRLGTEREAGKQLKRHARELCSLISENADGPIATLAKELLNALSRIEQPDAGKSTPSHDHRRLSKSMAFLLRHKGPEHGVAVDEFGFTSMEQLAIALNADSSQILAVAEHPGEPRFEVKGDEIRALYGHSLEVKVAGGIKIGKPLSLYHGTTWTALDSIVKTGITPMGRTMVHLTNISEEAVAVGKRRGSPVVLAIEQTEEEEPVAEGIWVSKCIPVERISISNPFQDEGGLTR